MKISVLGCGRWGTFLAAYHSRKNDVMLWGRPSSAHFAALCKERKNEYLTLPAALRLSSDLAEALAFADTVIISIGAQQLRSLAAQIEAQPVAGKTFILCMKGIEADTGRRLTQVFREVVHQPVKLAVWVGPGHVEDFEAGIPNCMVVDSDDPSVVDAIVEGLSSDLIRLYKGHDLIGTEVGAAAKNVIGIAAGMLDGLGYSSMKGALMARGAREVARLIRAMGGDELSAYGLCHLGDYEATLFSAHSHNRMFGEQLVQGKPYDKLAEGAFTVKAMVRLGKQYAVELPICAAVDHILYEHLAPREALQILFARSVKGEFDT
ncbi:MAG: NAD(P)H-dependent glycerol-3-phosphate dehydrogenase [Faecalibacterium sp.]|jgi:glycerol-3-phosphate dehydrogenase (NAD(P)+)|nr:NAD(P)H-dependent glycerol-3-phosphate dehydrogenase [Faecalibacterium sp.]